MRKKRLATRTKGEAAELGCELAQESRACGTGISGHRSSEVCELLGLGVQDAFQLAGKGERSSQETCRV